MSSALLRKVFLSILIIKLFYMRFFQEPTYSSEWFLQFFSFNGSYWRRIFLNYFWALIFFIVFIVSSGVDLTFSYGGFSITLFTVIVIYLCSLLFIKWVRDMEAPIWLSVFPILSLILLISNIDYSGAIAFIFIIFMIVLIFSKSKTDTTLLV